MPTQFTGRRRLEGGLFNRLAESSIMPDPEVGMGATELLYSDRQAGTIVEVSPHPRKRLIFQEDHARRTDANGMSDAQTYAYEANPNGRKVVYTLRSNGRWIREGQRSTNGTQLLIGRRDHYHDFGF